MRALVHCRGLWLSAWFHLRRRFSFSCYTSDVGRSVEAVPVFMREETSFGTVVIGFVPGDLLWPCKAREHIGCVEGPSLRILVAASCAGSAGAGLALSRWPELVAPGARPSGMDAGPPGRGKRRIAVALPYSCRVQRGVCAAPCSGQSQKQHFSRRWRAKRMTRVCNSHRQKPTEGGAKAGRMLRPRQGTMHAAVAAAPCDARQPEGGRLCAIQLRAVKDAIPWLPTFSLDCLTARRLGVRLRDWWAL